MKVRCVRITRSGDGRVEMDSSPWLTLGREYTVVSVAAQHSGRTHFRLITDAGSLGVFQSTDFETSNSTLPSAWVAQLSDGYLELAPAAWMERGLWESYYDGDARADEIVKRGIRAVIES
jgi:hypothetical protein